MSSTNIGKSTNLYFPYYNPDIHFNKVNYTSNFNSIGDLLLTNYDHGLVELTGTTEYQNDYRYVVNTHTNGMWTSGNVLLSNNGTDTGAIVLSSVSTVNRTTTDKLSANNLNINTIFGLTTADPSVIDYNWYNIEGNKNIFGQTTNVVTDVEQTKLGYKLFTYSASADVDNTNNYKTGKINATISDTYPVKNLTIDSVNGTYSILNTGSISEIINSNGISIYVNDDQTLYNLEQAWPYKVQYNSSQWYHILTNGTEDALLTLPYENTAGTYQYLFTKTCDGNNQNNTYKYTPLGDIVKNDYYYICSYFDTRATTKTTTNVPSIATSIFNENTIQFLPLTSINDEDGNTFIKYLHGTGSDIGYSSLVASCIPVAFTTATSSKFSFYNDDGSIEEENDGNIYQYINPIGLEWGKNITVNTTFNYTCANMTNLADILTGWQYLPQNFTGDDNIMRGNLPYINVGLVIFVPTSKSQYTLPNKETTITKYSDLSAFTRYTHWLNSFGFTDTNTSKPFWYLDNIITTSIVNTYINGIYGRIDQWTNQNQWNTVNNGDLYKILSTPAALNYMYTSSTNELNAYDDHYNATYTTETGAYGDLNNFLGIGKGKEYKGLTEDADGIKLINVLSVPITNALNTTHTATDSMTFRFEKPGDIKDIVGDYYYIVGLYIYLTKNLPSVQAVENPHYLGFAPSTNITNETLLTPSGSVDNNTLYNYPVKCVPAIIKDPQNLNTTNYGSSTLMKDAFITPSIFMVINESVGTNL